MGSRAGVRGGQDVGMLLAPLEGKSSLCLLILYSRKGTWAIGNLGGFLQSTHDANAVKSMNRCQFHNTGYKQSGICVTDIG